MTTRFDVDTAVEALGGGRYTGRIDRSWWIVRGPNGGYVAAIVLRARPLEEKIATTAEFARQVLPLFDQGRCAPVIDRRFPLERVGDAHRHMEANANVGKIVLDVADL